MMRTHREAHAAVTIATLPVSEREAPACGIMKVDERGRVVDFVEKPKTPEALAHVRSTPETLARQGFNVPDRPYLASMGIYLFDRKMLVDLLQTTGTTDFGKEVFPQTIRSFHVQAHLFDGYWEDIGTVGAFHRANIELAQENPPFDFMSGDRPVFTRPRYLPGSRVCDATVRTSLIGDGCVIGRGSVIENSVIGVRARIAENVTIRNSYIMGADSFESEKQLDVNRRMGRPDVGIGAGSEIQNAIIDKNVRIGRNVRIVNHDGIHDSDEHETHMVRDGIVVIPKFVVLSDGSVI
jgi:glucose-1-phosphate adenylyltransferase